MYPAFLAMALCFTDLPIKSSDLDRFPLQCYTQKALHDADHFRTMLKCWRAEEMDDRGFWDEWLAEANDTVQTWYLLSDCYYCDNHQRLERLRQQIGMTAYYQGLMPPSRPQAPRLMIPWVR